jgi:hypothetical protein
MISETAEAGRLIMTQMLLHGHSFHPIEGLMYLAPASVVWMTMFAAVFEVPAILQTGAMGIVLENPGLFLLAATMGFGVMALALFTIQVCGSLTLKVCTAILVSAVYAIGGCPRCRRRRCRRQDKSKDKGAQQRQTEGGKRNHMARTFSNARKVKSHPYCRSPLYWDMEVAFCQKKHYVHISPISASFSKVHIHHELESTNFPFTCAVCHIAAI